MSALQEEVDKNAREFWKQWQKEIGENIDKLGGNVKLLESYRRITAVQALKANVVEPYYRKEAASFYSEAQNDALTSHVLASFGAWRSALQALRSCIENTLCALYYNDHPVELKLWSTTDFRIGFSALHSYFCRHPDILKIGAKVSGLDRLKSEYATLSKAVHASAPSFRMTDPAAKLLLWSGDAAKMSSWATRERGVIEGVCLLTVALHHDRLSGAALPNVRSALSFAISSAKKTQLKRAHIHIQNPV